MISWHVARHWAAGEGAELQPIGVKSQNGVDVQAISNQAIGFPVFGTWSLVKG